MPSTSPDDIFYADSSTPMSIAGISAAQASSVQHALTTARAIRSYRWADEVERLAHAGMLPGDQGYQADTRTTYVYSGSEWVVTLGDTGWLTPTLATNFTAVTGEAPRYRRKNGIVYLNGRITVSAAATGSMFVLPVGFRPAVQIVDVIEANGAAIRASITPTGSVSLLVTGSPASISSFSPFIAEG